MTHSEVQFLREEIKELTQTLANYIKSDEAWKEADGVWKSRAEPAVKAFENTNWLFKLFVSFLKLVAMLGSAGGAYILLSKYLKGL